MSRKISKIPSNRLPIRIRHILFLAIFPLVANAQTPPDIAILQGAPGEEKYEKLFKGWAENFQAACKEAGRPVIRIHEPQAGMAPKFLLQDWLDKQAASKSQTPLWVFFVGHGTYDGESAKFNFHGPDVSAEELRGWLEPLKNRTVLLINTASSSAPFLTKLSAPGRIIMTATRSGSEYNATQLANYLSKNIANPAADLDQDGQTSLLEAWLHSNRELADHYKKENRIQTEHSLLDDNADARGTEPTAFTGILPNFKPGQKTEPDGYRAHQFHLVPSEQENRLSREQKESRDALELKIHRLRRNKASLQEDEYYEKLEVLLRKLGDVYLGGKQ